MAIPLAEHLSGILGGAFHPVAAMKPDTVVDWNKLILDCIRADDIVPSDFEKEYMVDMASSESLPTTIYETLPNITSASTSATTGSVLKRDDMIDAISKIVGSGRLNQILDESIREVETCQVSAVKVAERRDNPVFGSW